MLSGEPSTPRAWGGAWSEDNWRKEFTATGLHVSRPPIKEVEVGINRVYGAFKRGELFVMDSCPKTLDEIMSYSRELDDNNEPTMKIADKNKFHLSDALRYVGCALWSDGFAPTAQPNPFYG